MHLAELAMDFADHHLRTGGALLIKLFQGVGFDDYVRELRRRYAKVVIRKPAASRKRSPEVYALAQGKLARSEEHTSELQSLMRISYAVFCLKKNNNNTQN